MAKQDATQYLKDEVLASTPKTVRVPQVKTQSADDFLSDVTADDPQAAIDTRNRTKLGNKAEKLSAADERRMQRQQEREERDRAEELQEQQDEERRARESQAQKAQRLVTSTADQVSSSINPAIDKIGSIRTVGGIGLLLVILAVLLLVVVQVDDKGNTRAKLFWDMLNGRAYLQGRLRPTGKTVYGGPGASGDFGTTPSSPSSTTPGATSGASGNFGSGVPIPTSQLSSVSNSFRGLPF